MITILLILILLAMISLLILFSKFYYDYRIGMKQIIETKDAIIKQLQIGKAGTENPLPAYRLKHDFTNIGIKNERTKTT
jgi:hypothetical protein